MGAVVTGVLLGMEWLQLGGCVDGDVVVRGS